MFGLLFEVGQMQVFENQLCDLVYVDFGFVVFLSGLIAGAMAPSRPGSRDSLVPDYVPDFGVAVPCSDVLLLAIVEPELVFIERANWNFDYALAVGEDDGFIGDDRPEVLLDRVAHTFFVAVLIDLTFALKRPIVS